MRKIKFLVVVSLMMLFVAGSYCGVSAYEVNSDFWYYGYDDGTIKIIRYIGTDENVVVPVEINGKRVTIIDDDAFRGQENLKSILLPEGLLEIGRETFRDCSSQLEIHIPNSVVKIHDDAFNTMMAAGVDPRLVRPLLIGDPNSYAKAYADSHSLRFCCIEHPDIIYTSGIAPTYTSYGRKAGTYCSVCGTGINGGEIIPMLENEGEITTTTKPEPATTTKSIVPVTTSINYQKGSKISSSSSTYKVTNTSASNSTVEYSGTKKAKKSLIIPATVKVGNKTYKVTSISKNVFKNNKKLKKVTVGNNIKKINANAFKGCKNLKTIIIKSKSLKSIGKNAFKGINPTARIRVPASKFKKYKKLFKKKGLKSTVKMVKI